MAKKDFSVLIVDDDIEVLKVLKKILESNGWQIYTSPTGTSALALLEQQKINIILLDIKLPDQSGLDVLKIIKEKYPSIPVIMITGFGYDDQLVNESLKLGAAGYFSKSTPIKELMETIENTIAKYLG